MIDRLITWSIRRRWLVIGLAVLLAIWGGVAAWVAPVDAIPDLSEDQVIVYAEWPEHGPGEIEERVTARVARSLAGLRGVRTIRSSSDFGACTIWVILEEGRRTRDARQEIAERLSQSASDGVTLPPGVVARLAPDGPATGQIFWYTVEGGGLDLARLREIHDQLVKPRLASVPGVAEVARVGGMARELQVEADPDRLRAEQVSLAALSASVAAASGTTGAGAIVESNSERAVRAENQLGDRDGRFNADAAVQDLKRSVVRTLDGRSLAIEQVARVGWGPQPRRGVLEKDGIEVVGGVVLMETGANPLQVTDRLKARIREIAPGLPPGVRIMPMYDRTPLIHGTVETVTGVIIEAMISAAVCIALILRHLRAAVVVILSLPLSTLAAFAVLDLLRRLGLADIQVNAMSLAGLAISIGVLVDSTIVMTENVLNSLRNRFGDEPVRGDQTATVDAACRQVGRPILFSILIMLISFLPVFALDGMEGKMFRPLAATKTLALAASGFLAITLVPALTSLLIRGRIPAEEESWVVRSVVEVYRPILDHLLDRPAPLLWVLGVTFIVAACAIGTPWLFLSVLALGMLAVGLSAQSLPGRAVGMASLAVVGLVAQANMAPLGREFMTPLDEGMVMDMPISVPGVPITQGIDDLKARDMILCRFPEVAMVVGKLGRAETPTDPAPLDMIETMVEFHPRDYWPARSITRRDASAQALRVTGALAAGGLIEPPTPALVQEIATASLALFDTQMREFAYQGSREFFRSPDYDESAVRLNGLGKATRRKWQAHAASLNAELLERAPGLFTRLALEQSLLLGQCRRPELAQYIATLQRVRAAQGGRHHQAATHEHAMSRNAELLEGIDPQPELDAIFESATAAFAPGLLLWRKQREELVGFGGELDLAVQMPGWTNVWTMPIQNRVDMLSTGVNAMVGIRVVGSDLKQVADLSERVAEIVRALPGAADVVADPLRGKSVVQIRADRERALRLGVTVEEINTTVATAIGGTICTAIAADAEPIPVRVRYNRTATADRDRIGQIYITAEPGGRSGGPQLVPLNLVAAVGTADGPATIKGENGRLRNYVRLNVRGRSASAFVAEAKAVLATRLTLPEGCALEWTGQFEHEERARRTMMVIVPVVISIIILLLYLTYHDAADALLMLLTVPGALAGGVVCQWILGANFSVTIWVGYIACFGMATATGVVMLVYLRDAIERAGGLASLDEPGLRLAVLNGAVHRLRPKLLTEATIILGLAPMLWAGGVGGEVIRPMAAPVLGGILIADEVIDLFLPVLFYRVRLRRLQRLPR